jgi:hypothetical protein
MMMLPVLCKLASHSSKALTMSNPGSQQRYSGNGGEEEAATALGGKDISNKVPHLFGSCGPVEA